MEASYQEVAEFLTLPGLHGLLQSYVDLDVSVDLGEAAK